MKYPNYYLQFTSHLKKFSVYPLLRHNVYVSTSRDTQVSLTILAANCKTFKEVSDIQPLNYCKCFHGCIEFYSNER